MFTVEDDEKQEKSVEIDPEVASTDSPDSSGSSFSGYTGQTVTWRLQGEFKLLILKWKMQQRSVQDHRCTIFVSFLQNLIDT